jgi:hypothetical protein
MRRPQFNLKTMLWVMACAACFFAGARWNDHQWGRERTRHKEEIEEWAVRARRAEYYHAQAMRERYERPLQLLFPGNATTEQLDEAVQSLLRKHGRAD